MLVKKRISFFTLFTLGVFLVGFNAMVFGQEVDSTQRPISEDINMLPIELLDTLTSAHSIVDTTDLGGIEEKYTIDSNIFTVRSFNDFQEHIQTQKTELSIFPEWDYKEIHQHKYDFFRVRDTTILHLADNNGCGYFHPTNGRVTSEFGVRKWRYHYGIDLKLNTSDPVYCAFDGIVRISKFSKTYGNVVVVRHDNGLETLYAHLSKSFVHADSLLLAGEMIGMGGNTGRSFGSHLHFEIRYFDEAINPRDIIDFDCNTLVSDTLALCNSNFTYMKEVYELNKIRFHTVKRGDTLSGIAHKNGTNTSSLCKLNGISSKKTLRVGMKIRVR